MAEKFMPSKKAMAIHLSDRPATNGMYFFSGFSKCLKEAREVTGRAPSNGKLVNPEQQGNWLGIIGYMALLDQIGSCFKPINVKYIAGNSIKRSLGYFTNLSDIEIDALYGLRCAFSHDFSLYNICKKNSSLTHRFKVGILPGQPVVVLPQENWDGDYRKSQEKYQTIISFEAFENLVEQVCLKLFELHSKDGLEVVLEEGGSDELLQRYSFFQKV